MTPQKCIATGDEAGDCFRVCVAMILNIPAHLVPNFGEAAKDKDSFHEEADVWLSQFGLRQGNVLMGGEEDINDIPQFIQNISPGVPAIVSGLSRNGGGHSMVAWEARWYDPARGDGEPITKPFPAEGQFPGGYWITFIAVGPNFQLNLQMPQFSINVERKD